MKTLQVNDITLKVAENADDLNPVRWNAIKLVVATQSSGFDIPDLISFFAARKPLWNQGEYYDLMVGEMNFVQRLKGGGNKIIEDSACAIFSIIALEPGEDASAYDATQAEEKMKRLSAAGITMKEVKEHAEGFISASPELCQSFFLTSLAAQMNQQKLQELLHGQDYSAAQLESNPLND